MGDDVPPPRADGPYTDETKDGDSKFAGFSASDVPDSAELPPREASSGGGSGGATGPALPGGKWAHRLPLEALTTVCEFVAHRRNWGVAGGRVVTGCSGVRLLHVCVGWRRALLQSRRVFPHVCPRREVARSGLSVRVSGDVRGGGTGREFKENLLVDGNEGWNKWFCVSPAEDNFVQYRCEAVAVPVRNLAGFALKSANDCPHRDPLDWRVQVEWVMPDKGKGGEDSGMVTVWSNTANEFKFARRFQWAFFAVDVGDVPPGALVVSVTLRIDRVGGTNGVQLGQFSLFEYVDVPLLGSRDQPVAPDAKPRAKSRWARTLATVALRMIASYLQANNTWHAGGAGNLRVVPARDASVLRQVCARWRHVLSYPGSVAVPVREVPRRLLRVSAVSGDVRGGGTGREFKENLLEDGNQNWNKWFSVSPAPHFIELAGDIEGRFAGYAVKSGNDSPNRDPIAWKVQVRTRAPGRDGYIVHEVDNHSDPGFVSRYQWLYYALDRDSMFDTVHRVSLHIDRVRGGGGVQLCQFSLFEAPPGAW